MVCHCEGSGWGETTTAGPITGGVHRCQMLLRPDTDADSETSGQDEANDLVQDNHFEPLGSLTRIAPTPVWR